MSIDFYFFGFQRLTPKYYERGTQMRVTRTRRAVTSALSLAAISLGGLAFAAAPASAADTEFTPVLEGTINGDLVMTGNSNILNSSWMAVPNASKSDGGASGGLCLTRTAGAPLCNTNSSSANVKIPAGARVKEARLYIETTLNTNVEAMKVKVAGPSAGTNYTTFPNADAPLLSESRAGTNPGNYFYDGMRSAVFDVTKLVSAEGAGNYTVADLNFERIGDWSPYASWSMVVAYEWAGDQASLDALPAAEFDKFRKRSVSWSDGLKYRAFENSEATLSGFKVEDRTSGRQFGKFYQVVGHAQSDPYTDQVLMDTIPVGNNNLPANAQNPYVTIGADPDCNNPANVSTDAICFLGSNITDKNPGATAFTKSGTNSGSSSGTAVNITTIRVPDAVLTPGKSSVVMTSDPIANEWLAPAVYALSIDLPSVGAQDDTASTVKSKPVTIEVLKNDVGNEKKVTATTPPSNGSIVVNADGTITYTPNSGYVGPDKFTYTITDSWGDTSTATVTINVTEEVPTPMIDPMVGGLALAGVAVAGGIYLNRRRQTAVNTLA